jgi:hypothetical protein
MTNYASLMSEAIRCNKCNTSYVTRGGNTSGFWGWLNAQLYRR